MPTVLESGIRLLLDGGVDASGSLKGGAIIIFSASPRTHHAYALKQNGGKPCIFCTYIQCTTVTQSSIAA